MNDQDWRKQASRNRRAARQRIKELAQEYPELYAQVQDYPAMLDYITQRLPLLKADAAIKVEE